MVKRFNIASTVSASKSTTARVGGYSYFGSFAVVEARRLHGGGDGRRYVVEVLLGPPAKIARLADRLGRARRAQWDFDAIGQWAEDSQSATHIAWLRDIWSRVEPHLKGSVYVNHVAADDLPEKVRASFGDNYQRLRELKAKFDPANLFRGNANIPVAAENLIQTVAFQSGKLLTEWSVF